MTNQFHLAINLQSDKAFLQGFCKFAAKFNIESITSFQRPYIAHAKT